ncbi:hypothetical protein GOBAR_DD08218 [Gossypium barbadense]|nr:hypothetical protein GOBAR_DD08218 [Gossypium barbadense]
MYKKVGVAIDLEEPTSPPNCVLSNTIYEQFCNHQVGQVERENELVVTHKEYSRDHVLPKLIEEPQPVPSRGYIYFQHHNPNDGYITRPMQASPSTSRDDAMRLVTWPDNSAM